MIGAFWSRAAVVASTLLVAMLLILLCWPEPAARALVPADGWRMQGGFTAVMPETTELRAEIRNAPQARFFQSWRPDRGNVAGTLSTVPFAFDTPIVVPYRGFADADGISVFLECAATRARVLVATGRTNTQWSEVLLRPHPDFCTGPVSLVARSRSTAAYVAIGTPFAVSGLSVLKQSVFVRLAVLTFAWAILAGLVLGFARISTRLGLSLPAAYVGLAATGTLCYLQFFVFWWSPLAGCAVFAVLALFALPTLLSALLARGDASAAGAMPALHSALLAWLLVGASLTALLAGVDDGSGAWAANGRFTPARWSTDNQIPGIVAEAIGSGRHELLRFLQPWSLGDRPPLVYGWHAGFIGSAHAVPALADGHLFPLLNSAAGIAINTLWVVPAALLLFAYLGERRARWALLVLALSPFLLFNSVYIWPKLVAGCFGVCAAMLLFADRERPARLRDDDSGLVLAAILSALALQSHGGAAFGILCSLIFAACLRGLPSLRGAALAACAGLAMLLPWSIWQSINDMGHNPLVKQAFAGTFGFENPQVGVLETIRASYATLTPGEWLRMKGDAAMSLLFGLRNECGLHEAGAVHDNIDALRRAGFYYPLPAIGPLVLGLAAILVSMRAPRDASAAWVPRLAAFGIATLALTALLSWKCHINHHQSYQAFLALLLALVAALERAGGLWRLATLAALLYALTIWIVEPFAHFIRFDRYAIAVSLLLLAIWGAWIAKGARSEARTRTP